MHCFYWNFNTIILIIINSKTLVPLCVISMSTNLLITEFPAAIFMSLQFSIQQNQQLLCCGNLSQSNAQSNSHSPTDNSQTISTVQQTTQLPQCSQSQRVRVTLQLTVSQSVCLCVQPRPGFMTRCSFLIGKLQSVHMGRPHWREVGSVICQSVSSTSPLSLCTIFTCCLNANYRYNIYKAMSVQAQYSKLCPISISIC
jgi:hypothetical protein